MKHMITTVAVLGGLTLFGCGGDETTDPGARFDSLCREWCTCSGNASPSCLDSCKYETTQNQVCRREEYRRYYSCMVDQTVDGECVDPFDDCERGGSESYETCRQETEERCAAQCEGTPNCMDINAAGMPVGVANCVSVCEYGGNCEQAIACYDFQRETDSSCSNTICWAFGTGACEAPEGTARSAF